jgi:[histone H3]-lysine36 N-dimethyltransferase SETMAR
MDVTAQRHAIQFCVLDGKSFTKTFKKMQVVYGEKCLSRSSVYKWFTRFKNGRQTANSDPKSGRPRHGRCEKNKKSVEAELKKNPRATVEFLSQELHISHGTIHKILKTDLRLRKIAASFIPHKLTQAQKDERVRCADNFIITADNNPDFLVQIVTGDESWCYQYEPSTKRQTAEWCARGAPRPTKTRAVKSKVKAMVIAFFDSRGMIHTEFVPSGRTVTGQFYTGVMNNLRGRIRRERRDLYGTGRGNLCSCMTMPQVTLQMLCNNVSRG